MNKTENVIKIAINCLVPTKELMLILQNGGETATRIYHAYLRVLRRSGTFLAPCKTFIINLYRKLRGMMYSYLSQGTSHIKTRLMVTRREKKLYYESFRTSYIYPIVG